LESWSKSISNAFIWKKSTVPYVISSV